MKGFQKALILFLLSFCLIFPQEDITPIATAGSVKISVEEFRNRYEFMTHLNYSGDNPDTLKKEFLYSLLAEKLWTQEVFEFGKDTPDAVKYSIENLRNLLIKDELYWEKVESKINISEEEIAKRIINS